MKYLIPEIGFAGLTIANRLKQKSALLQRYSRENVAKLINIKIT